MQHGGVDTGDPQHVAGTHLTDYTLTPAPNSPPQTEQTAPRPVQPPVLRALAFALLFATMLAITLIRVRMAPTALERDEGEYAYAAQLALQGTPPFVDVFNMKMPGIYWAYAVLIAVFGPTQTGIHLGFLAVNLLTILLAYRLVSLTLDPLSAALAASTYAWLSIGQGVFGAFAHATHFVILFTLTGFLMLAPRGKTIGFVRPLLAGLALGTAFTMKQHAAPFILLGGACLLALLASDTTLSNAARLRRLATFSAAVFTPFLIICLVVWRAGVFSTFWFWTFTYAQSYVSQIPIASAPRNLLRGLYIVSYSTWSIWLLAIAGLAALRRRTLLSALVAGILLAGLVAITPGFIFREHYFVLLLPAIAMLATLGAREIASLAPRRLGARNRALLTALLVVLAWGQAIYAQRAYLFTMPPFAISRVLGGTQPFPESVEIADYIAQHSTPGDRIAILGSEPQIYFYANRRAASPYVYMYPLMENQPNAALMQQDMIRGIESARPKFIVVVNHPSSWGMQQSSQQFVQRWYPAYLAAHYRPVGMFDLGLMVSEFYWEEEMTGHAHHAEYTVDVYQRLDSDAPQPH